jgi:transposase InsO family protein
VSYGYRRVHVLLRREGWSVNVKRVYRIYKEEGLQIRTKRPRRKVSAKDRSDRNPPSGPNEVWAMDFLSDQLFDGRRVRILTIVDAFPKISPGIDARVRYTGADLVATLNRVTRVHGSHMRSVWTTVPSSSRGISICGLTGTGLSWLLPTWQADRQWLRRGLQWQGPG